MSQPATVAPLDDPAERARALLVLAEARGLVAQFRLAVDTTEPADVEVPGAPKLPRL